MTKKHTPDDILEAYIHAEDSLSSQLKRTAIQWLIPSMFVIGGLTTLFGSAMYAEHERSKMLPEGGLDALLEECEVHIYNSDLPFEQRFENQEACVDEVWEPATERRDEILNVGLVATGGMLLGCVFSAAVGIMRNRRDARDVETSVDRYMGGLDFRRGNRSEIKVIDGGKPRDPQA